MSELFADQEFPVVDDATVIAIDEISPYEVMVLQISQNTTANSQRP